MSEPSRELAAAFVERCRDAIQVARQTRDASPVATVNRSFYGAFYAVSAVFASEGRTFVKHSGVRSALHRDLVSTGRVPKQVGAAYDALFDARGDGDYNVEIRLSPADASLAIERAELVAIAMLALLGEKLD